MPTFRVTGRASILTLIVAASGCFSDPFMPSEMSGTQGVTPTSGSGSGSGSGSATGGSDSTSPAMTSQIRVDDGVDPSTGGLDESDGDSGSTSSGDSSTGTPQEESSSTGETILTVADLELGDLLVTEVMGNPACTGDNCEWIEVYNATAQSIDLLDLYVYDSEFPATPNFGRITDNLVLVAGEYVVLAKSLSNWNFEFDPAANYGPQPGFNNDAFDWVVLADGDDKLLGQTPQFFFANYSNVSLAFSGDPDVDDIGDDALWCPSADSLAVTSGVPAFGSPGGPNVACAGE